MPELPEVETIRRQLGPKITNRTITGAGSHESAKFLPARKPKGKRFLQLRRRGKYLLIRLEFSAINILSVSILCIIIIFLDNILGNLTMKNISFIFLMYLNLFIPLTLEFVKNK